jgi:S1-C subfamily serine protease
VYALFVGGVVHKSLKEDTEVDWYFKLLLVFGSFLIESSVHSFDIGFTARGMKPEYPLEESSVQLTLQASEQQLYKIAQSITVRVYCGETWGSGILIRKQGNNYGILTNAHIINPSCRNSIRVQLPDNKFYSISNVNKFRGNDYDLVLISFRSSESYAIASVNPSTRASVGNNVFAAGFPFDAEFLQRKEFAFTKGKIQSLSDKAFDRGYQIGYTNLVEIGMSGGPLINQQGQVIGINGKLAYPLWTNPYVFADNSVASESLAAKMSQLSWAIPIQAFLRIDSGIANVLSNVPSNSQVSPAIEENLLKLFC